jgi:hypothetical protein
MAQAFRPNQPVVVIDTKTRERHLVWAEVDSNPPRSDPKDEQNIVLFIRPGVNFEEGHRYVVALRNMRDAGGKLLPANQGFRIYRDGIPTNSDTVEGRRGKFEGIFQTLAEAGIERDDLYRAWDFTVASERNLSERLLSIRDDAFRQLGDTNLADMRIDGNSPAFKVTRVDESADPSSKLLRVVHGTVTVPCYLDQPGCPPGSQFAFDPTKTNGPPQAIPGNRMDARFMCIVPRSAATTPARVALYGHGLLGSRDEAGSGQLQDFAAEHNIVFCGVDWIGMSCADFDPPTGVPTSFEDLQRQADEAQRQAGILFDQISRGAAPPPPNCDYPTILAILHDMSNFPKLPDRVQQGILNFLYVGRALIHPSGLSTDPAFAAGGHSTIDTGPGRLYYDGNSQGGIIGGALAAAFVDGDRLTLGVPGMNYSTLLQRSTDWGTGRTPEPEFELPEYSFFMYSSYREHMPRQLVLSMIQMLWDRGEANGYAHHMTNDPLANTPRHEVLLHGALGDHQVAQIAAEVEARTIGARVRMPYAPPGRDLDKGSPIYGVPPIDRFPYNGSAFVLWDIGPPRRIGTGTFGTNPPPNENIPPTRDQQDPHGLPRKQPAARQQKSVFLTIGGSVVEVCPPPSACLADPTR